MIRNLLKASILTALGCTASIGYAQDISTNSPNKLSFELLTGMNSPDMETTVNTDIIDLPIIGNVVDLDGITNMVTDFIPESESGINFGLRGNYKVWNNISAYGQLSYSKNGTKGFGDVQSLIDPLLSLLSTADLPIDPTTIRLAVNQDGDYNMFSSTLGLRYDYTLQEKFNFGVYGGLGYYHLKTPGISVDLSATVLFITLPVDDLISLDQYSDGSFGWQAGANITYNLNKKVYVGMNVEYNKAEFDYSSMRITVNEGNIPSFLTDLSPIDLSIIPDIPLSTKIDLSSMKFGIILGMHI